ncbi:MAG: hypothetical protein AAF358_16400 [Pseudomonadota bacterium]
MDNDTWSPVPTDLGQGFSHMAWHSSDSESALYGALPDKFRLTDGLIVKIENGRVSEEPITGGVTGLQSVRLNGKNLLLASGRFNDGNRDFGLVVWDGQGWRYLAEIEERSQSLTVVRRDGRDYLYALDFGQNSVIEYDGFELVRRQVPLLPFVRDLAQFPGILAACDSQAMFLSLFDGTNWALLSTGGGCRNVVSRRFDGVDQILFNDSVNDWLVYETVGSTPQPLSLPIGGDRSTIPISAAGDLALGTLSARQDSQQLSIWEDDRWYQPELRFTSTRLRARVRSSNQSDGLISLFGQFGMAPDPLQTAVAVFGENGVESVRAVPDQALNAVVTESGVVYAATPDGLWLKQDQDESLIEIPEGQPGVGLALTSDGELFVGTCDDRVLRLQDQSLEPAARLPQDYTVLCDEPLIAVPSSSPASGIYFTAQQAPRPFEVGVRVSVWRLVGTNLTEVSPPGLNQQNYFYPYLPQVSLVEVRGNLVPAVGSERSISWFDGSEWTTLPAPPEELFLHGTLRGPIATARVGGAACFFASFPTGIAQFCNDQWSIPSELRLSFTNSNDYFNVRGITTMVSGRYQGRGVLIVGGRFDAAGRSTQSRTAVLDLDVIRKDGFEP